jgi:hypothetical protein
MVQRQQRLVRFNNLQQITTPTCIKMPLLFLRPRNNNNHHQQQQQQREEEEEVVEQM